jgi:hypothetical protein
MIDLAGMWRLKDANNEFDLPVMIPGDIHSALAEQKVIPDPFFGTNEYAVQWVGARGWSVSRSFSWPVTGAGEGATRWLLEIDVVDTVAEIYLNGTLVGRSTSMFVPLRVDVSDALRRGENQIEVRFDSPESAAADRVRRLPYSVPHQIYPVQSMHRNLLRKAQCHSGWDWVSRSWCPVSTEVSDCGRPVTPQFGASGAYRGGPPPIRVSGSCRWLSSGTTRDSLPGTAITRQTFRSSPLFSVTDPAPLWPGPRLAHRGTSRGERRTRCVSSAPGRRY